MHFEAQESDRRSDTVVLSCTHQNHCSQEARYPMDEERCWQAVLARETDFDGAFVYAVRSTGIFCRPTCPSRRPGRAQVLFFGEPAAAEQAGFRACRRCRPGGSDHSATQIELAERARALIDQHPDEVLTLD